MDTKMTAEQYLSFMSGQITVLKYAWATLIATQPNRASLIDLIKRIPDAPIETIGGLEGVWLEFYKRGIRSIVQELEELLRLAVLAEQSALQKPGKG